MSDIDVLNTANLWSNYDPWMNKFLALAYGIQGCNPLNEVCPLPFDFSLTPEQKELSFTVSILYPIFELGLWMIPLIFHYTMIENVRAYIITNDPTQTGLIKLLYVASFTTWIGNLVFYAPTMVMTLLAAFPASTGVDFIKFFLQYTVYDVLLIGGVFQIAVFVMNFATVLSVWTYQPQIWAWWATYLVWQVGSYFTFYFYNGEWIQYYTYGIVLEQLTLKLGSLSEDEKDTIIAKIEAETGKTLHELRDEANAFADANAEVADEDTTEETTDESVTIEETTETI